MTAPITVETRVPVPLEVAWRAYTDPDAITRWNFTSPDWCCPRTEVDLRHGGRHTARMEARDSSVSFDFAGTYVEVDVPRRLSLRLDDGRLSDTTFEPDGDCTCVRTIFNAEETHPREMQRDGWQAILDNCTTHVRETTR